MPIRGLDLVLADLATRQRQFPTSKNQPLQKYGAVADTVGLSSDTQTATVATPPYVWAVSTATPPVAGEIAWGLFEWS